MKPKIPKARVMWVTVNPQYPGAHGAKHESQRVCDCTWGKEHTRKIYVLEIPADGVEALVERAALAGTNVARKFCDQPPLKHLRQSQNPEKNMELTRAVLTAAGIPCKRKARK